jgi:basic membrane protein A
LTSMLKRVDVATYDSFKAAKDGTWKAGIQVFGLKNDGVGYATDEWNKTILTDDARKAADAAKADIISGKISVHDFMSDNKCPV